MTDGTEYLRAADIAQITGVSMRTVRRWIADETIPSTKLGGARLVAKASLDRLLFRPSAKAKTRRGQLGRALAGKIPGAKPMAIN
jgi:excisionase family DNA binding protein